MVGSAVSLRRLVDEVGQVFPEEVAAVDDFASAHVEEVDGQHALLVVEAEDVGVLVVGGGDALLVVHLVDGDELVAQAGGKLVLLGLRRHRSCGRSGGFELAGLAVEKELHVADGLRVGLGRGEAFDAGAEAALDVVLQAGARVVAREVDLATGDEEAAVDEVDQAVREVAGKVGAEVGAAVLAQAAGDEDFGIAVGERELDVGVGLVVAQQDVEARLALLDEVVFEREGFVLVGDGDVVHVDGLAHQRAGLGVGLRRFEEVGANARPQVLRLADVDHLALGVLVEIAAGERGEGADFRVEIHEGAEFKFSRAVVGEPAGQRAGKSGSVSLTWNRAKLTWRRRLFRFGNKAAISMYVIEVVLVSGTVGIWHRDCCDPGCQSLGQIALHRRVPIMTLESANLD